MSSFVQDSFHKGTKDPSLSFCSVVFLGGTVAFGVCVHVFSLSFPKLLGHPSCWINDHLKTMQYLARRCVPICYSHTKSYTKIKPKFLLVLLIYIPVIFTNQNRVNCSSQFYNNKTSTRFATRKILLVFQH